MGDTSRDTLPVPEEPKRHEPKRHRFLVEVIIRILKEKPLGAVGGIIVLALFIVGIFADLLAPYGYNEIELASRLAGPSRDHILGCDNLGRDMLSRIIFGARVSMIIGVAGSAIGVGLSTFIGMICGYIGGKLDIIVQRFVDAWMCFPMLFILLTVMAIVGGGMIQIIAVLGISDGIGRSRGPRSFTFWIKESMYVEAARAIGAPTRRILLRHLLPNILPIVIIGLSMGMAGIIMAEAMLSFLGFGLPPPIPSWGGMIAGPGRQYMVLAPWMLLWPGLVLSVVIFGINMLGDALRDVLDPRLRGGLGRYGAVKKKIKKA